MHADRRKSEIRFWTSQIVLVAVACLPAFAAVKCYDAEIRKVQVIPTKQDIIATVTEAQGNSFYRNAGEFVFHPVQKGTPLTRFMTLYTGRDSWVSLLYSGNKSSVLSVPPDSIFRLEDELPIGMLFKKGFTRSKSDFMMEAIKADLLSKDSEVIVSGVQDTGEHFKVESEEEQRVNAVRFGLRMVFEMDRIPVTFPLNNLYVWMRPEQKSAVAPILIGGSRSEPLQAFLWQLAPSAKVVWSGLLSTKTRRVLLTIGNSGTYIFQAFGRAGTSRTRSIKIFVRPVEKTPELFPSGIIGGDSIVFN
ncbi:MAG: hypothetical protein RL189_2601 [Pseudomonadota bacterium]|jgi:hypothetical protein